LTTKTRNSRQKAGQNYLRGVKLGLPFHVRRDRKQWRTTSLNPLLQTPLQPFASERPECGSKITISGIANAKSRVRYSSSELIAELRERATIRATSRPVLRIADLAELKSDHEMFVHASMFEQTSSIKCLGVRGRRFFVHEFCPRKTR